METTTIDPEVREQTEMIVREPVGMAVFQDNNFTDAMKAAENVVKFMSSKCAGPRFISEIQGKNYPKVEWWTTVGSGLGLFPVEIYSKRLERHDEIVYESCVEVRRGEHTVTRATAICGTSESRWSNADEYAIKSMATTRATGKAFRLGLSFLASLAGIEPTSAEEIPTEGFPKNGTPKQSQNRPRSNGPGKKMFGLDGHHDGYANTGELVPKEFWDVWKSDAIRASEIIGGDEYRIDKVDGKWFIFEPEAF